MTARSMTKQELRQLAGCSADTFRLWLRRLAPLIPDYCPRQKLLTPAQVQFICDALGIEL